MKVNPQSFFNFCANHATLLRSLADHGGEISEADAMRLIRANPSTVEELPETAWRRLCELQILIPTEPGSEVFLMADPVARLLTYLFNEANPATPEMIRGYVLSLETTGKRLTRALDEENVQQVKLAFEEVGLALRRIHADLNETQHAILAEVARYKTERSRVTVREKYRRIVHWMERYVEPMIDIVRADGPLRAAFDETERLLQRAREDALFNDHPALARNLRFLRLVGVHALRVFTQCRKEIQPLYESLRRSSFIAEGAARALEKLQAEGLSKWGNEHLIGISVWRFQNVPGDAAISLALRRVAVFSYIIIDHAANQGRPIEEFIFGQNFLVTNLPHFSLDRYSALMRQVDVHDFGDLRALLNRMEQIGWVKVKGLGEDEFRFLRPFHRVFSKCLELAQPPELAQASVNQPVET